ncbi:hypothetical protein EJ04DRAFT_478610 [Polyplosphaeria fusca]|uniref:Uncharacterized protein n=1 Tax=Polyplosphaeria fusca TaxID=682080 RepID=A0A9P4QI26_9PLEO|nr:hypothetical protein EJ04DRAFT_478610 [Polyplosphaeria fusca]
MGGQAFATAGPNGSALSIPRMSQETYDRVRDEAGTKLKETFKHVVIPHEVPEKSDYGDVDFLVEGSLRPWTSMALKVALGAQYETQTGGTHIYALPHPEISDSFVEVDVEICPGNDTPDGEELFAWTEFMKAWGDLTQIIGICHRPLGLTCNDRGLHIRVEEVEVYDKKKSLIFLTRDVAEALEFYGLDSKKYFEGFSTLEQLFQWVSRGRFFSKNIFEGRTEKANDRSRMRKRVMYSRFINDFMPSLSEPEPSRKKWTRQEVLQEALDHFSRHEEYDRMINKHNAGVKEGALWKRIREVIPLSGSSLDRTVKGLKRWVAFSSDGAPSISEKPLGTDRNWIELVPDEGMDRLMQWIEEHYETARATERRASELKKEAKRALE